MRNLNALRLSALLLSGGSALALLVLAFSGYLAHAATITVNTAADELNGDADCSLREAIQAANTDTSVDACPAGSGADTISVPAGTYTLSIAGANEDANATGDLDIASNVAIVGAGAGTSVVDAADLDRVFHIISGVVEISGLTVQNGSVTDLGGGINNSSSGTLTVTESTLSANSAFGGPFSRGGALANLGAATFTRSTLSMNSAAVFGGGIFGSGTVTVTNSVVSQNSASQGAGITVFNGTLTVSDSTFSGNSANNQGGGIENGQFSTTSVTNSTFSGNAGSGIANGGTLTVTNSSFSGNSANQGGGIVHFGGTLTITNTTVSSNSAVFQGGGGGIANTFGDPLTLRNTIVANSTSGGNCSGVITDGGGNLSWPDTTCPGINQDPLLGPLALNPPGTTETHALPPGSPAINAAVACPPPATDQRGVTRPQGAACDIGAFELECTADDTDFDDDGIPNKRDSDDDDDGIRDGPDPDDDNDNIPDRQDPDDDNDGIPDKKDRDNGQPLCPA